jgi:hypothetical protein
MLLLASTSDLIRITTSAAVTIDVHVSWADLNSGTVTPGRTNTPITTATTTTIVASPASSTYRTVKAIHIRNRHASTACDITVLHSDGTNIMELIKVTLNAGDSLRCDENSDFTTTDSYGRIKNRSSTMSEPTINSLNTVVLSGDVVNDDAVANTIADVTGLSFPVVAGETYRFEFIIAYTSAAGGTGSRWSINGPAAPTYLSYRSEYTLSATTVTNNCATAYDIPAASSATSLAAGNVATIWGYVVPSSDGTVIARFASEVGGSAITAKAGSTLTWIRTL